MLAKLLRHRFFTPTVMSILLLVTLLYLIQFTTPMEPQPIIAGFKDAPKKSEKAKGEKFVAAFKPGPKENRLRKQNFRLGQKMTDPDDDENVHLDAGTTALMAFDKLSPEQVRAMRADTQELIKTQKELMDTFQSMAPMLTEGKKLMDSFGG